MDKAPRLRVLIVDDNADDAWAFSSYVRKQLGCDVQAITDPRQALDVAREFAPHLGLIDLAMPEISGVELAQQIRQTDLPPCLLVARTGHTDKSLHERCQAAGFKLVVVKPMPLDKLPQLLEVARKFAFANSANLSGEAN